MSKKYCHSCGNMHCVCHQTDVLDEYCAYTRNGRRCRYYGSMSPSIAADAPWYCPDHFDALDDPALCEAILRNSEEGKPHP